MIASCAFYIFLFLYNALLFQLVLYFSNPLLTFWHRDLNGHSPPSRTTFFSLGI